MKKTEIELSRLSRRVEQALDTLLPPANTHPAGLHEAMRYSVLNGGKRVRPGLVYATGQALSLNMDMLDGPACAVELIHAYSLIHDDLPAMDNDDLRRGKPTCHKAFGDALAILAGDAIQALAFYVLAHEKNMISDAAVRLKMIERLALAAGSRGMAGGQAIDLASVGRKLNITELEDMHIHKTGALIRVSVMLAAMSRTDLEQEKFESLEHFSKCIGLAFQIRDDILDVEGDTEILGKSQGADIALNKPTYPSILGMEEAKHRAQSLLDQAMECLEPFGKQAALLRDIANYIVMRPS